MYPVGKQVRGANFNLDTPTRARKK